MKKSKTARRIMMIMVGIMCLSTIFVFGAGSDSGIVAKDAPAAAPVSETTVQPQGSNAITATEATAPAVVEAAMVESTNPAPASLTPIASTPAVTDDNDPGSAVVDTSDKVEPIPSPPTGLEGKFAADPEKPFVVLAWSYPGWDPSYMKGFNIYRVEINAAVELPVKIVPYSFIKDTYFEDYEIKPGTTYRYWVTVLTKRGQESKPSNTFDVETVPVTTPSAPTGLAAYQNDPGVSLDWALSKEAGITGYNVYFSKNPNSKRYLVNTELVQPNHYYDKGGYVEYCYWVTAVNKWGLESKATMVVPTVTKPLVYEDSDPSLGTGGTWQVEHYVGPNDGKIIVAGDTGSTLKFNFTGSQVKMTGAKYWSCGSARVLIDGQVVSTINEYSEATTYNVVILNVPGLVHGNHTLTVEVLGSGNPAYPYNFVNVDSFEVR